MQNKFSTGLKSDFMSGVIVFLVALPLCLGIAQASHAPLFAGIVSGIIGGIVIGFLSGSQLSVSGPAAGLTAIVLTAITKLGAFEIFLCSVIVAGAIQFILGLIKAGSLANFIPSSVIEGMLAGIGLTIIIKQLPEAAGYIKPHTLENPGIADADDGFLMASIKTITQHLEPTAIVISILGIAILALWQTKAMKKLQMIPAGLIVVLMGTVINEVLKLQSPEASLEHHYLVNLPVAHSFNEFLGHFALPDFKGFLNPAVWETGVVLAIVASIETLLCIEATDKLDPLKRTSSPNRELFAQGIGNMLSGLIGGLPMTSVIVRSSANVNAGAKSKLSAILHGVFLLVCAASIPFILNLIPKASLAAILIFTGYKLCNPKVFKHMWKGGTTMFIPFVATAVAVVSLDLLKGVGIGLVISIIFILRQNMRLPFYFQKSTFSNGELIKITLAQEVSFLNKASIKETLDNLPKNCSVIIDASKTEYIDYDVLSTIREFHDIKAKEKNINISLVNFRNIYNVPETASESDIVQQFVLSNEIPKRVAGDHNKLLKMLKMASAQ